MSAKKALVTGAIGLVKKQLARLMLKDENHDSVIVVTRRPHELKDPKLTKVIVQGFHGFKKYKSKMKAHDYYFALGTPESKTGSKEAFLKVDVDYPPGKAMIEVATKNENGFKRYKSGQMIDIAYS